MRSAITAACLVATTLFARASRADEGMWTFNGFPAAKVQQKYGFLPTQAFLDHVRLSSVRLAEGCSASIISASGLVLTNHHCAHSCIEQLSTAKRDYVATGFYAKTQAEEVRCPEIEMDQLLEITDVTARMNAATRNLTAQQFNEARKAEMSRIERECATDASVRCDVVTLYNGAEYDLYKYRRFQDVRLVFAPEFAIAFFGGDPDNFEFPRYDLDMSMLRIYEDGKPASTQANYLPFAKSWIGPGDLTFVSGNPGGTSRQTPIAELEVERDDTLPWRLVFASELRGVLTQFGQESAERKRISGPLLFSLENSIKVRRGRREALVDPTFFGKLVAQEKALRDKVNADPKLAAAYGGAWAAVADAMVRYKQIRVRYGMLEVGRGFMSDLFTLALGLVRASEELQKPNEKRLREYAESNVPALRQELLSTAPIYPELEITTLTYSLTKLRAELGADDPFVKQVLGNQSPRELATALVQKSRLADVKVREALLKGGRAAIEASTDPMVQFARKVDPDARAIRKIYEDEVEAPLTRNHELIANAFVAVYGKETYPDATFTLRLSYGTVRGWEKNGRFVEPLTTIGGAFDRATGRDPFALPASWIAAKPKLRLDTPFNAATDNDIIGGNSGSPVINKDGELVGLIFDGNLPSLAGDYGFDPRDNRAVAVHSAAILEALDKIYGAKRIIAELR